MDEQSLYLKILFLEANKGLLTKDFLLFENEVSERTICGAMSQQLDRLIKKNKQFSKYFVDVEYNRNGNKKIKTCCVRNDIWSTEIVNINCDLIVHSRGTIVGQDNLIALEMKKSNRPSKEKEADKLRLKALTSDSFNDIWTFNGSVLPEQVCRYKLGIYYEINFKKKSINLEYYYKGNLVEKDDIYYDQYLKNHN